MNKSLTKNAIYSFIRNISSLVFPLVTLPYANRVLGVDNMGKYNFAYSIISYCLLVASLGVSGYAIREGSRIRDDRNKVSSFLSQMFSINIIATGFALLGLGGLLIFWGKLENYKFLILVMSNIVLFSPFALTWLFTIFEDYAYITKRTILFQIISLIMLFALVKDSDDLIYYCLITVVSNVGSNFFNFFYSKKYSDIHFTLKIDWHTHIKPIMVIFITSLAISIFVNFDTTMLGVMCSDRNVGLYGVSVKVYNLMKNGLLSVFSVVQARLAYYIGTNQELKYNDLINKVTNMIVIIAMPMMTGVIALSKEIVMILAGGEFIDATSSMQILILAIVFNLYASFFNTCVLMPNRRENSIFWISIAAAVTNAGLNLWLIPLFAENAAAFTTVIAEVMTFAVELYLVFKYVKFERSIIRNLVCSTIGCVFIIIIGIVIHNTVDNFLIGLALIIVISVLIYYYIQVLLRNPYIKIINEYVRDHIKK